MRPRRRVIFIVAAGLLLAAACAPAPSDPRPNVVLVSIDTLRADRLGCGGNPRGTSPYLDRLARHGTDFTLCESQAAATLPSHRSLLQSLPASRTSIASPMLAEVLRDAGWATAAWTGGGNLSKPLGFARGFDVWEEGDQGLGWSVSRFAAFLDAPRPERPFFAFLHGYDVHVPYDPPAPLADLYDPHYAGPVTPAKTRALCRAIRRLGDWQSYRGPTDLQAADRVHLLALYDAGIRGADRRIGELLRVLDDRGLEDRTLLVVVSDHGEEFWDHGSVLHSHTVYQELIHVPLIVRAPGEANAAGRVAGEVVRNLDVAPTIVDLAGLPPVPEYFGETLRPALEGRPLAARPAMSEMVHWKAFVRWPWKVIRNGAGPPELFDLSADPGELHDAASLRPDEVDALLAGLTKLVGGQSVEELGTDAVSDEQRARLRALGYVE